jgi:hypothetical protein
MWVIVRRTDGTIEEVDLPADLYIEIGDVLEDGSVVIDLPYPDDIDEDMIALELYDDEWGE